MELAARRHGAGGLDELLAQIQHRLFDLGAELATPRAAGARHVSIGDQHVADLEAQIDRYDAGSSRCGRSSCRAAVRRRRSSTWRAAFAGGPSGGSWTLAAAEPIRGEVLRFVNRLSDLLFVLARAANQANRVPDVSGSRRRGARSRMSTTDCR